MKRWPVIVLAGALLVSVLWGLWERQNRINLANALEAQYQNEFYNFLAQVEQVDLTMGKALVSNFPEARGAYFAEVWSRAIEAQGRLSELPFPEVNLAASRKFLAQVGDYCLSLARKEARGEVISADDRKNLERLRRELGEYNQSLHRLEESMAFSGRAWTDSIRRAGPLGRAEAAADQKDEFIKMDNRFQELPALEYDGPFSDHLERLKPRGLTGKAITRAEAERLARSILPPDKQHFRLQAGRELTGKIPCYTLVFQNPRQPETIQIQVTKTGGHLAFMINSRAVGGESLNASAAVDRAVKFAAQRGLGRLEPVSSLKQGGYQVVNLVRTSGGSILYPDMVKVKVALDNGEIVGWDAFNYLMAAGPRKIPRPAISVAEARTKLHPELKIRRVRKALIPLDSGKEVLCYELRAERGPETYLIYINARTGAEERIFKVMKLPQGEVVM